MVFTPGSRVFIGNLPSEKTSEHELREIFGKYGQILEVVIRRSFGFVQYETPASAQSAITAENLRRIGGNVVELSVADNRKSGGKRRRSPSPPPVAVAAGPAPTVQVLFLHPSCEGYSLAFARQLQDQGLSTKCDYLGGVLVDDVLYDAGARGVRWLVVVTRYHQANGTLDCTALSKEIPEIRTDIDQSLALRVILSSVPLG